MYERKTILSILTFAWATLVSWNIAFATTLAAKKNGVKVLSEPSKKASAVTTLKKSQTVEGVSRKGMYWKVKTSDGKEGYVAFLHVKRQAEDTGGLGEAIRAAAHESRDMDGVKGARSRSAVMGVRGLDESGTTASAGNSRPNMRMVYAMEDRSVSERKLKRLSRMIEGEIEMRMRRSQR